MDRTYSTITIDRGMATMAAITALLALGSGCGELRTEEDGQRAPRYTYQANIAPLLKSACATCHTGATAKDGYDLSTWRGLLGPGSDLTTRNAIPGDSASKLITALPRPVLVNAGMRYTEAAQIGLFGFTGDYDLVFEGSVVCLVTDRLGVGAEYRQKPDNYKKLPGLIKKEDDWWTLWAFYIVNDHLTVSGGYGHLGDVLNHAANATWGFNVKWEF